MLATAHTLIFVTTLVLINGMLRGKQTIGTYLDLIRTKSILTDTVKSLELQNKDLDLEILKIKSSPLYAKKVLRDKYHVTDDHETIVFFGD